jgi:transcriptional regulator with XRE-family HTH domain
MHKSSSGGSFNADLMRDDMKSLGMLPIDLARSAGVSHMAVSRFLSGERQTPRMAKKFADALGHEIERYLIRSVAVVGHGSRNEQSLAAGQDDEFDDSQLELPLRSGRAASR